MKKLRKIFTVSVMAITVLSMSFVVAPSVDAAQAGDLVMIEGNSAVYFLGADGKRHVFPNEATYFSWYADFSGVTTVSQSELDEFARGGNVTVRPGTVLITAPDESTVYAVEEGGVLRSIVSEENAIALYGADWASNVVDIIPAFMSNYTNGSALSAGLYPAGTLVKAVDAADVYLIDASGNARKFTDGAAFLANNYKWDDIVEVTSAIPAAGDAVEGAESALTDVAQGGGTGTVIDPNAGSGMVIGLSADTPSAGNIPAGSPVDFLKLNFTAAADGDVSINAITLAAYDLGTATFVDSVAFYDNGVKVGNSKNMTSDRVASFNFATPIVVAAGTTKSLTVRATIESGQAGNFAIGLASASAVITNGAVVSGSFPIEGNTKAIVSGTNIGTVTMSNVDATASSNDFGEDDVLLASFDLAGANEPILWESARFKNGGTNKNDIVSNLKILVDGDVVSEEASLEDKFIIFPMGNYLIAKGDTVSIEVYGDLGVSSNNDTINLYVYEATDFSFIGQDYGFGITMGSITSLDASGEGIVATLTTGDLTIDMNKATTPAADVRAGTKDVVLATFSITSNGENATVNSIASGTDDFKITGTGLTTGEIENIEMRDTDTGVVYDITETFDTDHWGLSMTDEITLMKGVTKTFEIRCDLGGPNDSFPMEENDTLQVTVDGAAMSITGDESDSSITDITPSSVTSAIATVKAADLDWTTVVSTNKTVVPGADEVTVYTAALDAGDSSAIDITSVKISTTVVGANAFTDSNITKLDLYLDGVLVKSKSNAITEGTGGTRGSITFNSLPSSSRKVAAGASNVLLEVKATFASTFTTTGTFNLGIESATASVIAKDDENNAVVEDMMTAVDLSSRAVQLASTGALKVDLKIDDQKANSDSYVIAGTETTGDYLGELVFTVDNEEIMVETLVLGQEGTAVGTDIAMVHLYDEDGVEVASKAPTASGDVNFSSFNHTFAADQTTSLYIGVTAKSINALDDNFGTATFGRTIKFTLASSTVLSALGLSADTAITAKGVASGEDITCAENTDGTVATDEYASWGYATSTEAAITGSALTLVDNDMLDGSIPLGNNKIIGEYKFVFDNASNRTSGNEALKAELVSLNVTIATTSVTVANVQAYISGDSSNKTTAVSPDSNGVAAIDFSTLTGDLALVDGTVVLVIEGDVASSDQSNDSLSTSIADLAGAGDFTYNGNANAGTGDVSDVRLELSELSGASLQ
jgi:hypothetical protein